MNKKLSIVYITCRREPMFEWFVETLISQYENKVVTDQIIFIDSFFCYDDKRGEKLIKIVNGRFNYTHTSAKPSIWRGEHKITRCNFFDASGTRNTGIILSENEHIVFVDDLSALADGWLNHHRKAAEDKIILCGADHLITGNLNNFFKEDFDIGILWSGGKVNNTVVLVNTELGNKEKIVSFFQERTNIFYELALLEKSWLGDQISIQSVLEKNYQLPRLAPGESLLHKSCGLKFKFFNYSEEFVFGVKKSSAGYSKTAIFLDFKGNSRKRWFADIAQEVLQG